MEAIEKRLDAIEQENRRLSIEVSRLKEENGALKETLQDVRWWANNVKAAIQRIQRLG